MEKMIIEGGYRLVGEVPVSGAKNAALPLFAASLLVEDAITLQNVPALADIRTVARLLRLLGVKTEGDSGTVRLNASKSSGPKTWYWGAGQSKIASSLL